MEVHSVARPGHGMRIDHPWFMVTIAPPGAQGPRGTGHEDAADEGLSDFPKILCGLQTADARPPGVNAG